MRLLFALLVLIGTAVPAFAADDLAQRQAVATQLVQLTTAQAVMGPMIDAIWPSLQAPLAAGNPNVDAKTLAALKQAFTDQMANTLEGVIGDYASAYAADFTLDELNSILAFYRSDAGVKLIAVQPKIMGDMLPKLTAKLQTTLPAAMQAVLDQAKEEGLKITQ